MMCVNFLKYIMKSPLIRTFIVHGNRQAYDHKNKGAQMKHLISLAILLTIVAINALAIDPKTAVNEAQGFYSKGEFDKAVEKYKSIINDGYVSSELYYNLGNAYFKSHNIKAAILNYEKAKLFDPADKDIDYNLELARSYTIDKIEALPELFFVTWLKWLRNRTTSNGWAMLSTLAFLAALALLLLYLLSGRLILKKISFWCGLIILIVSVASFVMGFQLKEAQTANNTAIIYSPTVTVKSSPSESGNNLFILHEGSKIEILDKVSDWCEIKIADGNRGWVKKTDLETI
jgi:tetratricopeptide (TPR) repeat protein